MAHRIVPKISLLPYRVQGVQSATTRLRLLEVSSFHSGQASVTVPDGHPNSPAYGHLKLPHLN